MCGPHLYRKGVQASITAFSGKPRGTSYNEAKSGQEAPVSGDAGNSFGGRASKRAKSWLARPLSLELFCLMVFIKFYIFDTVRGA